MKINNLRLTEYEIKIGFQIGNKNDIYILSEILRSLVSSHFCQDSFFDPSEVKNNLLSVLGKGQIAIKDADFLIIMDTSDGFRNEKYYGKTRKLKSKEIS